MFIATLVNIEPLHLVDDFQVMFLNMDREHSELISCFMW